MENQKKILPNQIYCHTGNAYNTSIRRLRKKEKERKRVKKIAALFVSIALVVSLAGCKGNTATDTTGAGETTQKTETKTSEEKKEET